MLHHDHHFSRHATHDVAGVVLATVVGVLRVGVLAHLVQGAGELRRVVLGLGGGGKVRGCLSVGVTV